MKGNRANLLAILMAQPALFAGLSAARQSSYIIARTTEANSGGPWYLSVPEQENPELGLEIHLRAYSPLSDPDLENQMSWWYGRKEPGRSNTYTIRFEPTASDDPEFSKDDLDMKVNANLDYQSPRMFMKESDIEVEWNQPRDKDVTSSWSSLLFSGNDEFLTRFSDLGAKGNANEIMIKEITKSSKEIKGRFYACDEGAGMYLGYEYDEDPRDTCKPVTLFFRKSKLEAPLKEALHNVEEESIAIKRNQLRSQRANILQRLGFDNVFYASAPSELKKLVDKILVAEDRNPLNPELSEASLKKTHYRKLSQIKKKLADIEVKQEHVDAGRNSRIEVGSKPLFDLDDEEPIGHRRGTVRAIRLLDDEDPFTLEPELEKQIKLDNHEAVEPTLQVEESAARDKYNWLAPAWLKRPERMETKFLGKWREGLNSHLKDIQPIIVNMQTGGDQYAMSDDERKRMTEAIAAIKHWNSLGRFLDEGPSAGENLESERR